MLSIVTPTSGRPEAFALLEQWVAVQDYAHPIEWIVATDDAAGYTFRHRQVVIRTMPVRDQHSLCTNLRAALAACHGEKIVIMEDDDYYAPHYLTTMADWLDEFPLVGSAPAIYYHVGTNRYRRMQSQTHASLAQTGITLAVYHDLVAHCGRSPFVDLALWRGWHGPRKLLPSGGLHVSIKGMPGKRGIGIGHRPDMGAYDEDLQVFRQLKLPEIYLRYVSPPPMLFPAKILSGSSVSVAIICHNYGRYLKECTQSVLDQKVRPREILIVDDSSDDETRSVAESYANQGVGYLRIEERDVFRARGAGFTATHSEFIVFLDADDCLPVDYLARGLPLFGDRHVGFVYSDFEHFGDRNKHVKFPEWKPSQLERENFVHAGSIVRRSAIEISGVFDGPSPVQSHADWFLWRKLADAGWTGAKSPAVYRYRQHAGSMLREILRHPYYEQAALADADITIFTAISGRSSIWPRYGDWLATQTWPKDQCRLILMDTSQDEAFGNLVREDIVLFGYPDIRYIAHPVGMPGLADLPRKSNADAVRLACKRIYGTMARELHTPFVFVVEDDVIPQPDAIERLLRSMDRDVALVAAPYHSRFGGTYVLWGDDGKHRTGGRGVETIGGCGFGATLIRRAAILGETFATTAGESPDYDIAFCRRLRANGWTLRADWDQKAMHLSA